MHFLPRGHTVKAVCESFHLAKDSGFKVVAHMMPDLPNVGLERDIEQFIVSVALSLWTPNTSTHFRTSLFFVFTDVSSIIKAVNPCSKILNTQ